MNELINLRVTKKELSRAEASIEAMKQAKTFDEYEVGWLNYLSYLENVCRQRKVNRCG